MHTKENTPIAIPKQSRLTKKQLASRRLLMTGFSALFPTELRAEHGAHQEMEALMDSGQNYGLVVPINHISLSDPPRIFSSLLLGSEVLRSRRVVIPATKYVAEMFETLKMISFCEASGIEVPIIMTDSSRRKEEEAAERHRLKEAASGKLRTFARRIYNQQKPEKQRISDGQMALDYIETAVANLKAGGIVIFSTQKGRRERVEVPEKGSKPLFQLCRRAENAGADVLVMPITIYYPGQEINNKFNFFDRAIVVAGKIETYDDIRRRAAKNDNTVDQDIHESLAYPLPLHMKSLEYWGAATAHDVHSRR